MENFKVIDKFLPNVDIELNHLRTIKTICKRNDLRIIKYVNEVIGLFYIGKRFNTFQTSYVTNPSLHHDKTNDTKNFKKIKKEIKTAAKLRHEAYINRFFNAYLLKKKDKYFVLMLMERG